MKNIHIILTVLLVFCVTSLSAISSRQLEGITNELQMVNKLHYNVHIIVNDNQANGIASIRYSTNSNSVTIYVDQQKLREESNNTWAFIIGHELAHKYFHRGNDQESEWAADVQGAHWAVNAGYSAQDYVNKLLSRPNYCGEKHGCWHERAKNIARNMRVRFDTSKDYKHRGHKTAKGAFPSDDHNECIEINSCCNPAPKQIRIIPCQHKITCQHLIYRGRFPVGRRHVYDVLHPRGDIIH